MTGPRIRRISFHFASMLPLVLCAPGAFATPPASTPAPASTAARETATKTQLAAVRSEIARIAAAQQATTTQRGALAAQLATQAAQLNDAAKALRASDTAIATQTAALDELRSQHAGIEASLASQRAALAELLRAAYTLDRGSDLSLLLGDDDIARIDRALAYSRYFQHDRIVRIRGLLGKLARLNQLQAAIQTDTAALRQQRAQRTTRADELEQARAAQQKLLADADAQLAQQKDKLAQLQRDAQALDQLLKRLQNVFADIPAQLGQQTPFAQLRGKLAWPVAGTPHRGTGTLAQGIVIAASAGAAVHAVAYGRVAWASFMRGFGMLVIIDHGDGWMSLYGGNEAVLVAAGDWVKPGQSIATVGRNSEQGGAWFGLRHDGKPVDPEGWFTGKH